MTVFELGDRVEAGDKFRDVSTNVELEINERGFPPRRSAATASRLHWSREVALTVMGKHIELEGRLLFAGPVEELQCKVLECGIVAKSQAIPVNVPVVGALRLRDYDCPAVALVGESLTCRVVVLDKKLADSIVNGSRVGFVCSSREKQTITLEFSIDEVCDAPATGRLLEWVEEDEPVQMV